MTSHEGKATRALTDRPNCDLCNRHGDEQPAAVDGATTFGWAYMCEPHFRAYGKGLGLGKGQILLCNDNLDDQLLKDLML